MHEFAGTQWGDTPNVGSENIVPGDSRTLLKKPWWHGVATGTVLIIVSPFLIAGFVYEYFSSAFRAGRGLAEDMLEG